MSFRIVAAMLACLSMPSLAADFTVGPDGTYTTVQAGIDAALAAAGDDRVLVQAGSYSENLSFDLAGAGDRLELSGGWDTGFSSQTPRTSVLDGAAAGRVVDAGASGSDELVITGFEITNGFHGDQAGLRLFISGNAVVGVIDNAITDNLAEDDRAQGGGLSAMLSDGSHLDVVGNTVSGNTARSLDTVDVRGGGIQIQTGNTATLAITDNEIVENSALIDASGTSRGGGVDLALFSSETAEFSGNLVARNETSGGGQSGTGLFISGNAWQVERNRFLENPPAGADTFARQVVLAVFGTLGIARDNLVADVGGKGIHISVSGSATAHVNNLTAVNAEGADIQATVNDSTATLTLYNSLASDSQSAMIIQPEVDLGFNLFGGELGLIDIDSGDYRLTADSPARNAGTNTPPGGLGTKDLADWPRILEGTADIGAFEFPGPIFADRFEGL